MLKHKHHYFKKELVRFFIILAVVFIYCVFAIWKYGVQNGLSVAGLSWSFFVFATPIADAGFIVGLPLRIFAKIKMLKSQIGVWVTGVAINTFALIFNPEIYQKTPLLQLFYEILTTPWPLWIILFVSFVGTLISIIFDDKVYDLATSKNKQKSIKQNKSKLALNVLVFTIIVGLYVFALYQTNIEINAFSF